MRSPGSSFRRDSATARATVAAITGLVAKENVVGTFGILYGLEEVAEDGAEFWGSIAKDYTAVAAYAYLIFNLLCAPCFAAIGAIKREMNNAKWTWFAIGYQCLLAYCVSLVINQVGSAIFYGVYTPWLIVAIALIVLFIWLLVRPYKEATTLNVKVKAKA